MEEKYYEILRHYVNPNDCATVVKQLLSLHNVSKSNSIDVETLSAKVFMLANELAIAGYGNAAVKLHTVHNGMITKGDYYSC